jgi:hypothetical protein
MPVNRPNITGTDPDQEINAPSAVVVLWKKGSPEVLGKFALSVWLDRLLPPITREVTVDGKKFDIALRFKRVYKPYTIHLTDFHHDKYIGTSIPKDYKSEVRLVDPTVGEDRKLDIWMNNPLRHGGETIYQSGFRPDNLGTVLQVVRNPGWRIPYIACTMVALGLVFHFGVTLTRFLLRMF